jgi:hypothetical protein
VQAAAECLLTTRVRLMSVCERVEFILSYDDTLGGVRSIFRPISISLPGHMRYP